MIDILKAWREFKNQKAEFRNLEKTLDLPKDSIQFPYEKELVMSGMPISEVMSTHRELLELATRTPFSYNTVVAIHREVKDIIVIGSILDYASQRAISPFIITDIMNKKHEPTNKRSHLNQS